MTGEKEKPPPTRRIPGGDPGSEQSIELAGVDEAESTDDHRHNPARCKSCTLHPAFLSWNESRRDELERESWARGRHRLLDMAAAI